MREERRGSIRGAKKEATSSSNNQGRRRIGGRENLEQATSKRKGQILSMLKGIHGGVRYLGKKREFGKRKRSN